MPTHQAAAAILVRNRSGKILMVANPYRDELVLPGGIIEQDESPATAAAREVREETGLSVLPTRLLVVEHLPADETAASGLRFVFDAAAVDDDVPLIPQPGEVSDLLWLAPDTAAARHTARGRKRVELAIDAQTSGDTVYLDGGARGVNADRTLR